MIAFNINRLVKVKLTDAGKEIIQQDYEKYCALYPRLDIKPMYVEDEEGYTEFQLWDFMRLFGEHFMLGCPLYIENNEILFCTENKE